MEGKEKSLTIRIDEDLHTDIKVRIAKEKITLKDYIVALVKKDLYGEFREK